MKNYTVNLPQTNFPMKADLPKREPKLLDFWQQINLYQSFASPKKSCGSFVLHDGPPYANGDIHLGHALNKILKDIINKSKLFEGFSVPYVPGWDCHGLPIELNVEKKLGKAGVKVSVEKFVAECRKYAAEQIQVQMKGFERLGVIGDWKNFYSTMDFKYEANIVRSLMEIVEGGYLVRGYKPVHWCSACGSALAEAEVEYKDITSPAIDVRFKIIDSTRFDLENISIPIWTTTPWTLPANEAVAVNPQMKYLVVYCPSLAEHLVIAEDLLAKVMERYQESNYKTIKSYLGKDLAGLILQHPFLDDKQVPVILGEHVTADMGTGAVHTAPAHGPEDYEVGVRYQLPIKNPVGGDGRFIGDTKFFAGQNIFEANYNVIALLKEKGNLLSEAQDLHSYPHCWRHKTPLIFRTTEQWFIGMDKAGQNETTLRKLAQKSIENVTWVPAQGENSIRSMIELRPDWCISRQRFWGIPITLFIHKASSKIHPEMLALVERVIIPKIEQEGLIYWHNLDALKFLQEYAKDSSDADEYLKVSDTLDVWFNSGVSNYCVLKERHELHFPADLYVEGSDQYRGWFQSSLIASLAISGQAPYKAVVTHGFCVDGNGHKMSKSLGNVISPKDVIDKYGADVLRLWVGSTYLHDDLAASTEIFARNIDAYRMLRNTARFLLGNLFDFNFTRDLVASEQMLSLDRFAVWQMLKLAKTVRDHYSKYQFHTACSSLQVLLANDISSFYFSIIKDRLYTMASDSFGRRSAQSALYYILEILVRIIAPILSFTAEEIWQEMRALEKSFGVESRAESVFMARWNELVKESDFDLGNDLVSELDWYELQNYRTEVNKLLERLRADGVIGSSLEAEVTLYGDDKITGILHKVQQDLRFILIVSSAEIDQITKAPSNAIDSTIAGLKLVAKKSQYKKCSRCWHYLGDVGSSLEHPELCPRCISNLYGGGEKRYSA